jgi:quercetin dioxygenase-like cupin family protein
MSSARDDALQIFQAEGLEPRAWSNQPGFFYDWHVHPYDKALICVEGSITFHTRTGDIVLAMADRLDLPAGTDHAATVGPHGVACLEAAR